MKLNAPHPLECLPSAPLWHTSPLLAVVPTLNIREHEAGDPLSQHHPGSSRLFCQDTSFRTMGEVLFCNFFRALYCSLQKFLALPPLAIAMTCGVREAPHLLANKGSAFLALSSREEGLTKRELRGLFMGRGLSGCCRLPCPALALWRPPKWNRTLISLHSKLLHTHSLAGLVFGVVKGRQDHTGTWRPDF